MVEARSDHLAAAALLNAAQQAAGKPYIHTHTHSFSFFILVLLNLLTFFPRRALPLAVLH
jgi:hypothetical protein